MPCHCGSGVSRRSFRAESVDQSVRCSLRANALNLLMRHAPTSDACSAQVSVDCAPPLWDILTRCDTKTGLVGYIILLSSTNAALSYFAVYLAAA